MLEVSKACFFKNLGWVELDRDAQKCFRAVIKSRTEFLDSEAYKNKEGIFWPPIKKIEKKDTKFSSKEYDKFDIYEVEYLPHIVFWPEMSSAQILESHIFLCDVLIYLSENNYTALTHLWNITLHKGKPIFIDLGDFVKRSNNSRVEIDSLFSNLKNDTSVHNPTPISNWLENHEEILKKFKSIGKLEEAKGILLNEIELRIKKNTPKEEDAEEPWSYLKEVLKKIKLTKLQEAKDILLNKTKLKIKKTGWENYNTQKLPINKEDLKSLSKEHTKGKTLCEFIDKINPKTLTDLGCNNGIYSFYSNYRDCQVVGIDNCESIVSQANNYASNNNLLSKFVNLDILSDKCGQKLGKNGGYEAPTLRFKSEMVIAPALGHHLFRQCKDINKVINSIIAYTNKYAAIEFIPHSDPYIYVPKKQWFSMDEIISILKENNFNRIEIKDSSPDGRKWIFAEKIKHKEKPL